MKFITKLTLITLASVVLFNSSYASLQDCLDAAQNVKQNYKELLKLCKPYEDQVPGIMAGAYYYNDQYKLSAQNCLKVIQNAKDGANTDKVMLASTYQVLGNLYYFGKIPNKVQKGLQYITKGAELGNATAQKQLGDIYAANSPIPQNMPLSYQWYQIAIINGNNVANNSFMMTHLNQMKKQLPYCLALGQDNVGQAYYEGIGGLQQNTATALDWLEKAADTDPNVSQVNLDLAKMYYLNGDTDKAFTAAQKAATQPLAQAMQYLGTLYQKGVGTDKDLIKAYAYLSLAVELYNNPATKFWQKYVAPCRPNYQGRTKEFTVKVAKEQLSQISLNSKQKQQAEQIIKQVKGKFKQ